MRILVFTDIHGSESVFKKLRKKSKNVDFIICCGDLTVFEDSLAPVVKKIGALKKEVYLIHGNHEHSSHVKKECDKYKNVHFCHKRVFKKKGFSIFGYGGGGFATEDKDCEKCVKKNKVHLQKKNILITHQPPANTKMDEIWDGRHVGSKTIKKYIKYFDLACSGHIHETEGNKQTLGKTLLINPGPDGRIVEWNLEKQLK